MKEIYENRKITSSIQKTIPFELLHKKKINITDYWVTFKTNTQDEEVVFLYDPKFKEIMKRKLPEFNYDDIQN